MQHNITQHNTIQYNTIQYNTIQYNTIQYNTIQYNTLQYNTTLSQLTKNSLYPHTYLCDSCSSALACAQPTNQPINQSTVQPINQSTNTPHKDIMTHFINNSINVAVRRSTNRTLMLVTQENLSKHVRQTSLKALLASLSSLHSTFFRT